MISKEFLAKLLNYYYRVYAAKTWYWPDWWGQLCRLSGIEDGKKYEIRLTEGKDPFVDWQSISFIVGKKEIIVFEYDPRKVGQRDYLIIVVYDHESSKEKVYNESFEEVFNRYSAKQKAK